MAQDIIEDSKAVTRAKSQIDHLGLPTPHKPNTIELRWPENVADISSEELAEHLAWCTGWASYAGWHLSHAETNEAAFEVEYATNQQALILNSAGDYKTVTELKASVSNSKGLLVCKAKILEAKALRKMLAALLEGYDKKYTTISREISRRGSEFEGTRRS